MIKSAAEWQRFAQAVLQAAGADARNAQRVAEALVSSNLCGVDTHGLWHLAGYVANIRAGEIVPDAWPNVLSETPSSALVSGNWAFGHVTAKYAMEIAIAKAKATHVAVVAAVQVHHIGRLGEYAEMAAAENLTAIIWGGGYSEVAPAAVPFGGRKRALHTNPVAMGLPAGTEPPIILDFATTVISGVKIVNARDHGEQLPAGAVVDKDGNPTTDPNAFFDGGGHVPFGGHKGYALMLAAEFFAQTLPGAETYTTPGRGGPIFGHSGVTMMVMRADLFRPLADYAQRADALEQRMRAVPPAPGFEEVLIPGDREARTRAERLRQGIPVPDDLWRKLSDLAVSLSVPIP